MHPRHPLLRRLAVLVLAAALAAPASAADDEETPPTAFEYGFGADLIAAGFFNSSAYFGNDTGYLGDEIAQWQEFGLEPKASFQSPLGDGTLFGALSVVWTYTLGDDASGLTIGIQEPSEVTLEQANVGWKGKDVVGWMEGETFTVTAGSLDYSIGTGMIINDGGSDGGERGGWYLGMRKTFQESVLLQLENDEYKLEAFRLKNRPRAGGVQGDAYGFNGEWKFAPDYTAGGSLISVDSNVNPVNRMTVFSGRLERAPETGFGFNSEVVSESNDQIEALGWFVQFSYTPEKMRWSPTFSFRLADFSGDDPGTAKDERFREIAYGYTDYGSWYQGEITGNYPLGNGNLQSNLLRVQFEPADAIKMNVLYYRFTFNEPASFGLTSDDWGDELDVTLDWEFNDELYLIGVLGYLMPGQAAVQMTGGSDDWTYLMLYASYAWSN